MFGEIVRMRWFAITSEIGRRAGHNPCDICRESLGDHIHGHSAPIADPSVEPAFGNVYQMVTDGDVELHVGVAIDEGSKHRSDHQAGGFHWNIDSDSPGRRVTVAVEAIRCLFYLAEWATYRLQKFFTGSRQRDAAVGSVQEAHADSRFQTLQRVTQCRSTDSYIKAGTTEAPMPRDRDEVAVIRKISST